jgi:phosphoglucosamine mutase
VGRLFGTDGVRGVANADLTPELAFSLAFAAARVLLDPTSAQRVSRPMVLVGRDTRPSGDVLEAAAAAGFASAGCDVTLVGVIPTPGVAFLTASGDAELGLMISASHNPMPDNGLKLFSADGYKLTDAQEDAVEAAIGDVAGRPTGRHIGRIYADEAHSGSLREGYVAHLVATVPQPVGGIRVVVDCAEGAAYEVGPEAYRRAGADVTAIFASGMSTLINDGCGATHLEALQEKVVELGADLGLAHDGDADRCLAVDASGEVVDGDQILALLAVHTKAPAVVSTVMANLGFTQAMAGAGIDVVQTAVGDRYVLEAMRERDIVLGGEQSGHLIMAEHATTGDGVLTGLQVLSAMASTGRPLADLAATMTRLPQVLVNVRVADRAVAHDPEVLAAAAATEAELGATGRVLLRPSGTESLVRVMVEAPDEATARRLADQVASAVQTAAVRPP